MKNIMKASIIVFYSLLALFSPILSVAQNLPVGGPPDLPGPGVVVPTDSFDYSSVEGFDFCMQPYAKYGVGVYGLDNLKGGCRETLEKDKHDADVLALKQKASNGDEEAQYQLGMHYCFMGWEADGLAIQWFTSAAEQGDADAQFHLGQILYSGLGVKSNPAEAYFWYSVAQKSVKNTAAQADVGDLEKYHNFALEKLSPDQLAVIDKRVREFKPLKVPSIAVRKIDPMRRRFESCWTQ